MVIVDRVKVALEKIPWWKRLKKVHQILIIMGVLILIILIFVFTGYLGSIASIIGLIIALISLKRSSDTKLILKKLENYDPRKRARFIKEPKEKNEFSETASKDESIVNKREMSKREYALLSYAYENLKQVLKVYEGLKKRRVNVWIDKKNMRIGRWKPQILKAISRSKYFVIFISNAALKKTSGEKPGFQDEELQIAWEYAREQDEKAFTIIPVRLEDCGRGDMRLSGWEQYDLFEDWEGVLDTLAVNLGGKSLSDATAIDKRTEEEKLIAGMMGKSGMYHISGYYEKSLILLEAAINIRPDFYQAWIGKGANLASLGRHDEALEAFNKVIEIKPYFPIAWYYKGLALTRLGRHDEALEAYNKAIEIKPDDHEAWSTKSIALTFLGRHDEALEALNKVIEIKPDFLGAWYSKGMFLDNLGRHDEALEAYNKIIETKPDDHEAWVYKGLALARLGRHDEALEAYNKAIEIKPDSHEAWYNKGNALEKLGKKEAAQKAFYKSNELKKILKNQPTNRYTKGPFRASFC